MTNAKSTKKALMLSILSLVLCFSMLIGTTFAWFTDSVTSANNIIKSGNLDIELEYAVFNADGTFKEWKTVQGASDILTNTLWEPGVTEVAYLRVANAGSLALKYQFGINIVDEVAGINAAGDPFLLSDYIQFGVVEGIAADAATKVPTTYATREEAVTAVTAVTAAKKISAGYTKAASMAAGGELYFALVVYMPTTVGNEANHNGTNVPQINLGINVIATQVEAEEDSFGTDYDADARYPDFVVSSMSELYTAIEKVKEGGIIALDSDIKIDMGSATTSNGYTDGLVYKGDKSFTIDLNGHTFADDGCVNDYVIYFSNMGEKANEITIKNGVITVAAQAWSAIAVNGNASTQECVLNLDNVIVNMGNAAESNNDILRARKGATINLNAGTVINSNGTSFGATATGTGVLNVNDGAKIVHTNSKTTGGNLVYTALSGTGTINVYAGAIIESDNYGIHTMTTGTPVVNVYGGTITAPVALKSSTNGGAGELATINVIGGTINGALETYTNNGKIVVTGGTFTADPTRFVTGYEVTNNGDGTWTVDEYKVSTGAELVDAIANGKAVELTQDVTLGKIDLTGAITNDVVIDANGHKITTTDAYGIEITAGKNVTISNADVEMTKAGDYITYAAGLKIANGDYAGATITLENCTITMANTDWAYAVTMPASVKNLNLVIDNCTLEGAVAVQCWGDNNTITITNSKLICNYTTSALYTSYCVALQGDGTNNSENNTLVIDNCEFLYSGIDNFNSPIYSAKDVCKGNTGNTVTVTNCTYGEKVVAN